MNVRARRIARIVLGVVLAALLLSGAGTLATRRLGAETPAPETAESRHVPVAVVAARHMTFTSTLRVSGNVQAVNYALVSARVPGTLDEVFVDEGDTVIAGETALFRTDALKLTKAAEVARQELAVAQSTLRERHALLAEYQAGFDRDELDVERLRALFKRDVATTYELDKAEATYRKSAAKLQHGEALIDLAEAQVQQARSRLTMAQKDLDDSLVRAPIDGRVVARLREPGEMAAAGTPVLNIEDLSVVEVSAFLPEEQYARVTAGVTPVHLRVGGLDPGERIVSHKSPTVDPQLRTFEIKCVIDDAPDGVVPGCIVQAGVILERRDGCGVPARAIEQRGGESVVFVVEGQAAHLTPVRLALETDGWVEVVEGDVTPGAKVVHMGQDFLENGSTVSVTQEAE